MASLPEDPRTVPVRVEVLGPLRLVVDERPVEVPGPKRRALLALLAMSAPRPVPTETLVDALWPGEAPASGRAALQSHVSRLRRHLGPAARRLEGVDGGYRLALGDEELDAGRAQAQVRAARARARTEPAAALELLDGVRGLWRGHALADLRDIAPLLAWARSLDDLCLAATELRADCALAAASHHEAIEAARDAVSRDPLRESAAALLVRALAAGGRTAEALRTAHDFRRRLAEETGLEPSGDFSDLEHRVADGTMERSGPPVVDRALPTVAAPVAPLVGRDAELAGVARLLDTERLVTLAGTGGVGKTHLALEAAHRARVARDVTVLSLAPLTADTPLADVLAGVLGVRETGGDALDACAAVLGAGRPLLVIDNCEHLLERVRGLVVSLISAVPGLTVLATSRERLGLPFEQVCPVAPLPLPEATSDQTLASVPSVALFVDRARRVRPDLALDAAHLETIAAIVRSLDGIPLAIELAAGRLASMGVGELSERLDRALDLLGSSPDAADGRHRTLRAAVEWSYALLPDGERRLFRNLAVFADGFDLASAETVADELALRVDAARAVSHLVDASMLVAEHGERTRYRMLETLRTFALDRLMAADESDAASDRLLRWACDFAEWTGATINTHHEARAATRLRVELGNLRAAWNLALAKGDLDVAATLVECLQDAVMWRDHTEVWAWAAQLAADPRLRGHPRAAVVLAVASEAAWMRSGDLDGAEQLARRAAAVTRPDDADARRRVAHALIDVDLFRGRFAESRDAFLASLDGSPHDAFALASAALAAAYVGGLDDARVLADRAGAAAASPTMAGYAEYAAAEIENVAGAWESAERRYRAVRRRARDTGATFLDGIASVGLVSVLAARGRVQDALAGYESLLDYWERTGGWTQQWTTLRNLAVLLDTLGDHDTARAIRRAADGAPEAAATGSDAPPASRGPQHRGDRRQVLALARAAIAVQRDRSTSASTSPFGTDSPG